MTIPSALVASAFSTIAAASAAIATPFAVVIDTNDLSVNTLLLLGVACTNAYAAVMAFRTHKLTHRVELATNSMKDALVSTTAKASHAEGKLEGVVEGKAEGGGTPMTSGAQIGLAAVKMGTAADKMANTADKAEISIDRLSKK